MNDHSGFNLLSDLNMNGKFLRLWDGWINANETWTYASANTINVPSGAALRYGKGDKVRWQNNDSGTYLYGTIIVVADTLLTIAGNAVPNATLTDNYYSHSDNPLNFPHWFSWTPVLSGAGGSAGTYAQTNTGSAYCIIGRTVYIQCHTRIDNKGSWSGFLFVNFPVTRATTNEHMMAGFLSANGANPTTASKGTPIGVSASQFAFQNGVQTDLLDWSEVAVNDLISINGFYQL